MKTNTERLVVWHLFKGMFWMILTSLFVFFIVVCISMLFITKIIGYDPVINATIDIDHTIWMYLVIMLMTGFVFPLFRLYDYLSMGVTRKQFAVGLLRAAVMWIFFFSAWQAFKQITMGVNILPLMKQTIKFVLYGMYGFIIGWTAAVGFHFARAIPVIIGIISAFVMYFALVNISSLPMPEWVRFTIIACILCLSAFLLLQVIKRIDVKC